MSNPLASIGSSLLKAVTFLLHLTGNLQSYIDAFSKAGPTVMAAFVAVLYDVTKTLGSAGAVAGAIESGNPIGVVTLSENTVALVQKLFVDFHAGEQDVVNAFKNLNLPAPTAAPAVAKA